MTSTRGNIINAFQYKYQHCTFSQYSNSNYAQCIQLVVDRILPNVMCHINGIINAVDVSVTTITEAIISFISEKFSTSVSQIHHDITNIIDIHVNQPVPSHNIVQFPKQS